MLTAADIERWDPGAVREVADAAQARAQAAFDAADALDRLPCFGDWSGESATAARESIARTRRDLDGHGMQASLAAEAARRAADEIEALRRELFRIEGEALMCGLGVDLAGNRIVGITRGREVAAAALQTRLNALLVQANSVDAALAAGIRLDGMPVTPPRSGPVGDIPPPEDPAQFRDLWSSLSTADRDLLYSRDHNIGNHPGMPAGSHADPGRDYYNRLHLADELASPSAGNRADLEALQEQLIGHPERKLMLFDPDSGQQVHAAIAVGDPDAAEHVSVTTPGLNTTVAGSMGAMVSEATSLRSRALAQLSREGGRAREDVAAIAWIGYDAPQVHVPNTGNSVTDVLAAAGAAQGVYGVSHDHVAKAGAVDLARFYDSIAAVHGGKPLDLTAIGHSYGSLTTGLALQQPGSHGVDAAIFYGSPGIEASTPAELGLPAGRVFTMETPDDPIQWVYDGPPLAHALAPFIPGPLDDALLNAADLTRAGQFGPNPATNPNFVHLETGPITLPDGFQLEGAHGHSDYPRGGSVPGAPRTTGYNIAAVVANLPHNMIEQK